MKPQPVASTQEVLAGRAFVVRIVEGPVVAPGRDSEAAIIVMDDIRSHLANHVPPRQVTVTRRTLKLLTKRLWEMSDVVDVLETWEPATKAASPQ
jgi:hypothetical protein